MRRQGPGTRDQGSGARGQGLGRLKAGKRAFHVCLHSSVFMYSVLCLLSSSSHVLSRLSRPFTSHVPRLPSWLLALGSWLYNFLLSFQHKLRSPYQIAICKNIYRIFANSEFIAVIPINTNIKILIFIIYLTFGRINYLLILKSK